MTEYRGLGGQLQAARQALGLNAADVAQLLNLTEQVIALLETQQDLTSVQDPYLRGYLRAYLKLLKLNPTTMPTPTPGVSPTPSASGVKALPEGVGVSIAYRPKQQSKYPWGTVAIAASLLLTPVLGYLVWPKARTNDVQEYASANPAQAALESVVEEDFSRSASLDFQFKDTTWVTVFDAANARLLTGVFPSGELVHLEGQAPFQVMLSNGKAATIVYNGQTIEPDRYAAPESDAVEFKIG
ncbi:MAG: RodZ domain-containing protein [Pseudomonadota bacterium]